MALEAAGELVVAETLESLRDSDSHPLTFSTLSFRMSLIHLSPCLKDEWKVREKSLGMTPDKSW